MEQSRNGWLGGDRPRRPAQTLGSHWDGPVLMVDDHIDTGWAMTVSGCCCATPTRPASYSSPWPATTAEAIEPD